MIDKSPICCSTPTILLNPYAKELILQHGSYSLGDGIITITPSIRAEFTHSFPYSRFSPYINGLSINNLASLDSYYITNLDTSEVFPLYMLVPCGKCECCKNRKNREWCFRALCESQKSSNIPYFVTLTYDNKHLPEEGVNKRDVQLFLKRLRRNLDRSGYTHNLRYFACAEYGSKTHRPHYHLILWNFPHMANLSIESKFIETAWQNGYIMACPSTYGSISYCMKYMRKDQYIPSGKNEGFFLSSRRGGGIGSGIADDLASFYRENPDVLDVSIVDKFSGMNFTSLIPSYFKRRWYPTMSAIVPKVVRDAYKLFLYSLDFRRWLIDSKTYYLPVDDTPSEALIIAKYSFLPSFRTSVPPVWITRLYDNVKLDYYMDNEVRISNCIKILNSYIPNIDFIKSLPDIIAKRYHSLLVRFGDSEDYDIPSIVYELNKSKNLDKMREVL